MDAVQFGTDGWRATLDEFTEPRVREVGRAIASYLDETGTTGPVAIGYDAREHAERFATELATMMQANGRDVLLPERDIPTPLVAWAVVDRDLAGAVVVTASHNPPEYYGIKFIPHDGAPALPAVTDAIEARLQTPRSAPSPESLTGTIQTVDFVTPYSKHALSFTTDLSGLHIVYDAMHGSGRGVTDSLLDQSGATVTRLRCDRDPLFGGTTPEPSPENLEPLVETINEEDADFGIANDGDADRIAIATSQGVLDENLFFATMYDYLLESDTGPAIRTVATTFLIDRIAAAHGESVIETPVGFKWVAEAMADHDALMGGEESGGFSVRGHIREKDGIVMAMIAAAAATDRSFPQRVDELFTAYGEIHHGQRNLPCPDDASSRVLNGFRDTVDASFAGIPIESVKEIDGLKVLLRDGSWLLVRPSGTEPKLRIYVEAPTPDRVTTLLDTGQDIVEPFL